MYNSSGSVAFFGAFLFLMHLTFRLNCKVVFSLASSSPVSDHNIRSKINAHAPIMFDICHTRYTVYCIYCYFNFVCWGVRKGKNGWPNQASVVLMLDSAFDWINRHPADKYYGNKLCYPLCLYRYWKSYPVDITIHRLNNCGQKFRAYNNILNYTESCKYTLPNGAEINIYWNSFQL